MSAQIFQDCRLCSWRNFHSDELWAKTAFSSSSRASKSRDPKISDHASGDNRGGTGTRRTSSAYTLESCANMSGTRLQKRARTGAREATLFRGFRTRRFSALAEIWRVARRMRVRRARSGGRAGLEARSRLRGYSRVDRAAGGLIRCSSGPAAPISLSAGGAD